MTSNKLTNRKTDKSRSLYLAGFGEHAYWACFTWSSENKPRGRLPKATMPTQGHHPPVSPSCSPGLPWTSGSLRQLSRVPEKLLFESLESSLLPPCVSPPSMSSPRLLPPWRSARSSLRLSHSVSALPPFAASPTSPDKKAKRHQVKSDPTPFGLRGRVAPPPGLAWRHFPIWLGTLSRHLSCPVK